MGKSSSGCYVVDSEYNVINVNEVARNLYPQLEIGKKCHACLMGLNEPCGPCPVAAGRKGPTTYRDPIRGISEVVDAVDINIEGYGLCHALVFSTVEDDAEFAATLPTSAEELKNLALIKALTAEYYDVFSVNLSDDSMTLYRHDSKPLDAGSIYKKITSYSRGTEEYIQRHVCEEDRETLRAQSQPEYLKEALKKTESLIVPYRVNWKDGIHYFYRKIVRIGDADTFTNIVIGVGCEDEEVERRNKQAALQDNLRKVEYNTQTGLLTKEAFFIYGARLLEKYMDREFDFCIMRVENLGSINHQYGRVAGDKVIQTIGEILKTYEKDTFVIAYFGDGMFGSLTENTHDAERKLAIEGFRDKIFAESDVKNLSMNWTIYKRIGRDSSIEEIFEKFNYAIATIRARIHNEYVEFDRDMMKQIDWDTAVEKGFHDALANGEFVTWYQPKYDVHTRRIIGAEALVRWQMPNEGLIPPGKFIPVLETCGLINLLDRTIFEQVCQFQNRISELGLAKIPISVNLSRASIFTNDIAADYSQIAEKYGVEPAMIPIEITESAAVRAEKIKEFTNSLIDRGFVLDMDDFGAGYSSLASLQAIPFEGIKLDKSLVDFIGKPSGESLLKHTIAFAKENKMSVIAEGVETMEQYLFLKVAGCDAIQGYYFSKPLPGEELLKLL